MTWTALAAFFQDDAQLRRADAIYELSSFSSFGRNNEAGHATGAELLAAFERGQRFFVGRGKGGLGGTLFAQDIAAGGWRTQKYETNRVVTAPPNVNWFSLADFVRRVRDAG